MATIVTSVLVVVSDGIALVPLFRSFVTPDRSVRQQGTFTAHGATSYRVAVIIGGQS